MGLGGSSEILLNLFWTGYYTLYVDTLVIVKISDKFHIGAGIRYDLFSAIDTNTGLNDQALNSNLGYVYTYEYVSDYDLSIGKLHGDLYFTVKYTDIDYTDAVTGQLHEGNTLGFYIGMYTEVQ